MITSASLVLEDARLLVGVECWVRLKLFFPRDRPFDFDIWHLLFLGHGMSQHGNFTIIEIEDSIVDASLSCPQLVDAVAKVVASGRRSS